jgi:hypothetical protein
MAIDSDDDDDVDSTMRMYRMNHTSIVLSQLMLDA